MVGLVLVSHSQQLAQGIEEVLRQMVGPAAPIALAAGSPNPHAPMGTEPMRVLHAMEAVYSDDGVVVLMDLGSALMSAEAALDFLPPEKRQHVYLCEAPLVEGAVAAATAAAAGAPLALVLAETRAALSSKHAQLAPALVDAPQNDAQNYGQISAQPAHDRAPSLRLLVSNRMGLHLRPAARLTEIVGRFAANVTVEHAGRRANARSVNQLIMLNVRQGDALTVEAEGDDALAALAAIQSLVADSFGDGATLEQKDAPVEQPPPQAEPERNVLTGVPIARGVAFGPLAWLDQAQPPVSETAAADPAHEWARLLNALETAQAELRRLRGDATLAAGDAVAALFDAQAAILLDPDLLAQVRAVLDEQRINAEAAWLQTILAVAEQYRHVKNDYLAQRSADVRDVGQRVLRALAGQPDQTEFTEPVILAVVELRLSHLLQLQRERVLGIVTVAGDMAQGATGHAAILARALDIPTVMGVGTTLRQVRNGQVIAMDGGQGRVWLTPPPSLLQEFRQAQTTQRARQERERAQARLPALLRDGKHIPVQANIDGPRDVESALAHGAEGVGVFRTEYLLMGHSAPPGEDEQEHVYRAIAQSLAGEPLIVRTFDIGGDKPIPFLSTPPEANPFLGRRGIRLCLAEPALFRPQLRALLRAGLGCDIRIMLPMVSTPQEVLETRAILAALHNELERAGVPHRADLPLGVMIETPAAVMNAPALARVADFFSVGTNDLVQYIMAADRNNSAVRLLVSPFQPAVLHSLAATVQAGHAAGIVVSVCGEAAADVRATPLLIGLGVDELSMSAPAIMPVKQQIRHFSLSQAQEIAACALSLPSADEVIRYLERIAAAVVEPGQDDRVLAPTNPCSGKC